jgi:hypothetical protein
MPIQKIYINKKKVHAKLNDAVNRVEIIYSLFQLKDWYLIKRNFWEFIGMQPQCEYYIYNKI